MSFNPKRVILYVVTALLFVATTFLLLHDKGSTPGYELDSARTIPTSYNPDAEIAGEMEIFFYPANPAPGDFVIVEAGPFSEEAAVDLTFAFEGVMSEYYWAGSLLYAVIAIRFDTEPGIYQLTAQIDSGQPEKDQLTTELTIAEKDFMLSHFSMPPDRTAGWTAARLAEDREKVRLARETTEPHPLWLQPFIVPLEGRISSEYGAIRIINDNPPRRHNGIDIAADEGTAVVSPAGGIVRLAEFLLSGGNTVIIDHGVGLSSTYMHLHTISVEAGRVIGRGELIGTVGMSGYATGPHLHWEVNIGQTPVNPEQLMQNELLWIAPAYVADRFSGGR
jgi:hypothetical protein